MSSADITDNFHSMLKIQLFILIGTQTRGGGEGGKDADSEWNANDISSIFATLFFYSQCFVADTDVNSILSFIIIIQIIE